jgi:hypothetical protein
MRLPFTARASKAASSVVISTPAGSRLAELSSAGDWQPAAEKAVAARKT